MSRACWRISAAALGSGCPISKRRHSSSCSDDSGITLSAHTKLCVTRACVKMFPARRPPGQSRSREFGCWNRADRAALFWWTLDFSPSPVPGSRDPALRSPLRGGVPSWGNFKTSGARSIAAKCCGDGDASYAGIKRGRSSVVLRRKPRRSGAWSADERQRGRRCHENNPLSVGFNVHAGFRRRF